MKWVIYLCCYHSQFLYQQEIRVSTVIYAQDSIVSLYIYPYQYVDFKVKPTSWISYDQLGNPSYATLYLDHPNGDAVLLVTPRSVLLYFHFAGNGITYKDNVEYARSSRKCDCVTP